MTIVLTSNLKLLPCQTYQLKPLSNCCYAIVWNANIVNHKKAESTTQDNHLITIDATYWIYGNNYFNFRQLIKG